MSRDPMAEKKLRARHASALNRPELTRPSDGCPRKASTGATSPMLKLSPDQELIEAFEKKRLGEPSTVLGAG